MDKKVITKKACELAAKKLDSSFDKLCIKPVSGGYSRNRRALAGVDGRWIFVKEVDTDLLPSDGSEELMWLQKDYLCQQKMQRFMPDLVSRELSLESNGHVLIMSAYRSEDGWLWCLPDDYDKQTKYIQIVIDTVKKLEKIKFSREDVATLGLQPYFRDAFVSDGGLDAIINDQNVRDKLINKFIKLRNKKSLFMKQCCDDMIKLLRNQEQILSMIGVVKSLTLQPNDCLGHCDVRSDNMAINLDKNEIKLVDWNWASYTPHGFGATEFLIDVARGGINVSNWYDEINIEMLAGVIGFYLKRCIEDPLSENNTLRDMQAESAAVALYTYNNIGAKI